MRILFPSLLTSTGAVSEATTELPSFAVADSGAVLGAFGRAGTCGTAAVALGGTGTLVVTFGGCGIAAFGAVITSVSTALGIAGAAEGTAGTGIAIGFGAVIAATAGAGFAVAVAETTGFEIDGAFGTTGDTVGALGNFGAVGLGTAATETCGFGGGAVGRFDVTLLGRVSWERGVDVGGAKSCPGARAALPGTKLADPCRRIPASVGAGPNLSSTLKSMMTFGRPTYRLFLVD
jgi:hypothetical protein